MEAKAIAKYIRIAPRKLRIVINLIRAQDSDAMHSPKSLR